MNKKIRLITLVAAITLTSVGAYIYLTYIGRIEGNLASNSIIGIIRPYPKLEGSKTVTLNCDYHGKKLAVAETVYSSLNNYYKSDPQKKFAYFNNKNEKFVYTYSNDPTIVDLATKIQDIGKQNNLSSDQTLDLAACFLQSIPYDTAKAAKVLEKGALYPVDQLIPRFPYETLYDGMGICTDKSYLGSIIFKQLGYKASLLEFDAQRHMSVGVGVPAGYGDFGTDYAILELTGSNFLVGDVPELNSGEGLAVNSFESVPTVTENQAEDTITKISLSKPSQVVPISDGTKYQRIISRLSLRKKLEEFGPKLETLKSKYLEFKDTLSIAEVNLNSAETAYNKEPSSQSYSVYANMYGKYTTAYNDAKTGIDTYNNTVKEYNALVAEYRQF